MRGPSTIAQPLRDPLVFGGKFAGTAGATSRGMAAVFALVFLPVIASIGVMIQIFRGAIGVGPGFALICFSALALGVFGGLLKMAQRWENEPD